MILKTHGRSRWKHYWRCIGRRRMTIGISAELGDESTGFAVLMRANGFNLLDGDGTKRGFMAVALLVDLAIL